MDDRDAVRFEKACPELRISGRSKDDLDPFFKNRCLSLEEGDTMLMLKKVSPTRLVKGGFFREVEEAENRGATAEELKTLLGKGRAKKGMFEGDLDNGELEIGQVASLFREQQTAAEIVHDIVTEYRNLLNESKEKLSI